MTLTIDLSEVTPPRSGEVAWVRPRPPPVPRLERRPHLLVVGAGVAGLAVAAEARRRQFGATLVIDAEGIAAAASGRNAGALIPDVHALTMPATFARLARRGLQLHRELHRRWGLPLRDIDWLLPLDVGAEPPVVGDAEGRAAVLGRRDIERRLGTGTSIARAVLVTDQARTDPVQVATALAFEAGGVAGGVRALRVVVGDGGRAVVQTTHGTIRPEALVIATGRLPGALLADQRWVQGHLVVTAPAPFALGRTAIGGRTVVIQQPDGRLLAGGTRELGHDDGRIREEVVGRVRADLARLLPAASGLAIEQVWTGHRPATHDGLPVVAPLPGVRDAFVIGGLHHSGLCTAPAIAEAIVSVLGGGEPPEVMRAFALDR